MIDQKIEVVTKLRKGRKSHICEECEIIIQAGDQYYNYTERRWGHRPHVNAHYCVECWVEEESEEEKVDPQHLLW